MATALTPLHVRSVRITVNKDKAQVVAASSHGAEPHAMLPEGQTVNGGTYLHRDDVVEVLSGYAHQLEASRHGTAAGMSQATQEILKLVDYFKTRGT